MTDYIGIRKEILRFIDRMCIKYDGENLDFEVSITHIDHEFNGTKYTIKESSIIHERDRRAREKED